MPVIDLSGFDVPGYAADEIRFNECTAPEQAEIRLKHCCHVSIDMESV